MRPRLRYLLAAALVIAAIVPALLLGMRIGNAGTQAQGGAILPVLVASLLMAASMGWLLSRLLIRPIEGVIRTTRQIAGGHVDAPLPALADLTPRELHELADAVHAAAQRLETDRRGLLTVARQVEAALNRAKEQTAVADRTKSEFLANVGHELRTPLNAILGFSELIKLETFGAVGNRKYLEYARDIHQSGEHLLGIINEILDISRIESGQMKLNEGEVDVARMLEACLRLLRRRAERAEVALSCDEAGDLPPLWADELKLKQVLLHLLSNAIKFTRPGGRVTLHAGIDFLGDLEIEVSDTGIGMREEDIPVALSPFVQLGAPLTRQAEGSGLGLALAKRLAELHGGSLEIESEVGTGTTARVVMPKWRVTPAAMAQSG